MTNADMSHSHTQHAPTLYRSTVWLLKQLLLIQTLLALRVLVRAVEHRPEEAAINGRLVQHHRILLVVAGIGGNGDDGVDAGGQLTEAQVLHAARGDEWFLWVEEHVRQRVHAHVVVGDVDAHRLLAHGALVRVTRRLVVIGERDDGGAHAQDHARVNL